MEYRELFNETSKWKVYNINSYMNSLIESSIQSVLYLKK